MVLTAVAPAPTFLGRFLAAWRGDESLAWVFWSYYVLVGLGLTGIHVALLLVLLPISGGDIAAVLGTQIGSAYVLVSDLVQLGYFAIAFVLLVRCISNVTWKGWQYAAMILLLGISYQTVERARDVATAILGG